METPESRDGGRPDPPFVIQVARDHSAVRAVSKLFREYADALDVDLGFQDFDAELATMPGDYGPPAGVLLLAIGHDGPAGCVGLRPLDGRCCEMKRLYVRASSRRLGIGRGLALRALSEAFRMGYSRMRLDTLPSMTAARRMYATLGFRPIPAYRHNPVAGTSFLELLLPSTHAGIPTDDSR